MKKTRANRSMLEETIRQLNKKPMAVTGMIIITLLGLIAGLADFLAPHRYMDQNIDEFQILQPFSFRVLDESNEKVADLIKELKSVPEINGTLMRKPAWMSMSTHVLTISVQRANLREGTADLISRIEALPSEMELNNRFPLGTDHLGRCVMSRLLHGARISLKVGFFSQSIAIILGIFFGVISGYYGKIADMIIMRVTDIIMAFPFLLLVMAMVAVMEKPGIEQVFVAMGLVGWPPVARIVRAQVLSLREKEFVEAANALGASDARVITRHILPNILAPVIVQATIGMAYAILSEAGLSFLGMGAQPPTPSWGLMVADAQSYLGSAWWLSIFPGIAVMITVFGFNLFGDGLRDALDPRMRS